MKSKKEMKASYNEMKFQMGVFQIRNSVNGKILIDFATNIEAKMNRHKATLRFGTHRNKELQSDWNQYGDSNFVFELITELEYQETGNPNYEKELKILEQMVLEEKHPYKERGYNRISKK